MTSLFAKPSMAAKTTGISAAEVKTVVTGAMEALRSKLAGCFDLQELDLIEFVKNVQESEMDDKT